MTNKSALNNATKNLGQCAKAIEKRNLSKVMQPPDYERLIGFGMARDWIDWAENLKEITYIKRRHAKSDRAYAMNELTRFMFMWTAANALFARLEVLSILNSNIKMNASELDRFKVLFNHSQLTLSDISSKEEILHKLLSLPMNVKNFPWENLKRSPTILEVIYYKYTVEKEQRNPFGRRLLNVATTNNYSQLDLPTLIYATRNWNTHGVLLSSSFRGTRKSFNLWIDTINLALAQILAGSSKALLNGII